MPDMIRDGGGSGRLAIVDFDGKLRTRAIGVDERLHTVSDGSYFELVTGKVTLTDAAETPIAYIKNTSADKIIVIDRVFFDAFDTTGGTGSGTIKYYRNPTVAGGTTSTTVSTNYRVESTPTATSLTSPSSMSGGTVWWSGVLTTSLGFAVEEGIIILASGNSHGISITPPAGNTSLDININIAYYQINPEEIA